MDMEAEHTSRGVLLLLSVCVCVCVVNWFNLHPHAEAFERHAAGQARRVGYSVKLGGGRRK